MESYAETSTLPDVTVTAVGSMPHDNADQAVRLILDCLKVAPHAPQLPRLDPREQMWIQFGENIPRFQMDVDRLSYYFDTSGDPYPEIERFYEAYLHVSEGGSADFFDISPRHGMGIAAFLDGVQRIGKPIPIIKVQVTGPLSFCLTITDETKKPIFYHSVFRDIAVKSMGLKAVRLLEKFRPLAEKVIVFFDEPSLSAYGSSAFLGVSQADVIDSLNEVMDMITARGGIAGVHCCGNTDWGLLMETSARIINFDAVDYMETLSIYAKPLSEFLARGGVLAWGAVCNDARAASQTAGDVLARINKGMKLLEKSGLDRDLITKKCLITPACGCAGLDLETCRRVYETLAELETIFSEGKLSLAVS
ncbi:MAG: hypothetical protein QG577_2587 [Thermodesulfobacteriota bacterium]|nr:hypothetical protein [Thermodesulfobacteriota bacterium]